ncbi:MAG TPA: hypothetical protein VJN18_23895 [Polyangiaceae bacterium]|nr:hypothetical protein [Polyangiaceae bacterium]
MTALQAPKVIGSLEQGRGSLRALRGGAAEEALRATPQGVATDHFVHRHDFEAVRHLKSSIAYAFTSVSRVEESIANLASRVQQVEASSAQQRPATESERKEWADYLRSVVAERGLPSQQGAAILDLRQLSYLSSRLQPSR